MRPGEGIIGTMPIVERKPNIHLQEAPQGNAALMRFHPQLYKTITVNYVIIIEEWQENNQALPGVCTDCTELSRWLLYQELYKE